MYLFIITTFVQILILCSAEQIDFSACKINCPPENMECAFDMKNHTYKLFSSKCAMAAYATCHKIDFIQTPLTYCIKSKIAGRRYYEEESCPVFCPNYYSPVCGVSEFRSYRYRTFNNGCYLDMLNCRGDEDFSSYIEVPLEFCQNHLMKNIFGEEVVVSNLHDYDDYE